MDFVSLVDTGASTSIISAETYKTIFRNKIIDKTRLGLSSCQMVDASGSQMNPIGELKLLMKFSVNGYCKEYTFQVSEINRPIIIGKDIIDDIITGQGGFLTVTGNNHSTKCNNFGTPHPVNSYCSKQCIKKETLILGRGNDLPIESLLLLDEPKARIIYNNVKTIPKNLSYNQLPTNLIGQVKCDRNALINSNKNIKRLLENNYYSNADDINKNIQFGYNFNSTCKQNNSYNYSRLGYYDKMNYKPKNEQKTRIQNFSNFQRNSRNKFNDQVHEGDLRLNYKNMNQKHKEINETNIKIARLIEENNELKRKIAEIMKQLNKMENLEDYQLRTIKENVNQRKFRNFPKRISKSMRFQSYYLSRHETINSMTKFSNYNNIKFDDNIQAKQNRTQYLKNNNCEKDYNTRFHKRIRDWSYNNVKFEDNNIYAEQNRNQYFKNDNCGNKLYLNQ